METLTLEGVLKVIHTQSQEFRRDLWESEKRFDLRMKKEAEERKKEAVERKKEAEERKKEAVEQERKAREREEKAREREEKAREREEKARKKDNKEWRNRMRKLEGNWGFFVESLVRPGLIELFAKHDIFLRNTISNLIEYKDKQKYYEIDLFSIDTNFVMATEVKTTLKVQDVKNHLTRMQKIIDRPPHGFDLKGMVLLGAVAGITIHEEADIFAQKNGLFVLKQKGNILDIVSPPKQKKLKFYK